MSKNKNKDRRVYRVCGEWERSESEGDVVEASSFTDAIRRWVKYVNKHQRDEDDPKITAPRSVVVTSYGGVIR